MGKSHTQRGYPVVDEDRKNLQSKDQCGLCKNVLKTAIQTQCGHRYCSECLEERFV